MRKYPNPGLLLLAGTFTLLLFSCSHDVYVDSSIDNVNEHEGGPSGRIYGSDFGYNLAANWNLGMTGAGYKGNSRNEKDWLPLGFEPVQNKGSWTIDIGPELIRKGSKDGDFHTHLTYLNFIGDAVYHLPLTQGELFAGAGPYLGYGLGGSLSGNGFSEKAFGGDDGYKRFDAGLHLKAGYRFPSSLGFHLSYELGLTDKSPDPGDYTSRNRALALNVSYSLTKILGGGKKK